MKKEIKSYIIFLVFLSVAGIMFLAGYFVALFGIIIGAFALGILLLEKIDNYHLPLSRTHFFLLSLLAVNLGTFLSSFTAFNNFLFPNHQVVIIGLAVATTFFILGWLSEKYLR